MRAAEEERRRWARELHDQTLQSLGGLRMLLAAARRDVDSQRLRAAVGEAVDRIEDEIHALRGLIRELRPAALDELGAAAAIEDLAARASERHGLAVTASVRLAAARCSPELETALYRIVQEALTNAVRHGDPHSIHIDVAQGGDFIHAVIRDDGHGFDPDAPADGFGLTGMRERVALLHGELELLTSTQGTTVAAALPAP
jgi:signal transduction histidine kinase